MSLAKSAQQFICLFTNPQFRKIAAQDTEAIEQRKKKLMSLKVKKFEGTTFKM